MHARKAEVHSASPPFAHFTVASVQTQLQLLLAVMRGLDAFLCFFFFFFPSRRGAAGMLLETSRTVRKTLMPRGRSECRVRADSVVAP